jgi:hypothetical protein
MTLTVVACTLAASITASTGFDAVCLSNPTNLPRHSFEQRSTQLIEGAWSQLCTARPQGLDRPCAERSYYQVREGLYPEGCDVEFDGRHVLHGRSDVIESGYFLCNTDGSLSLQYYW